jgi:hypothetical protein
VSQADVAIAVVLSFSVCTLGACSDDETTGAGPGGQGAASTGAAGAGAQGAFGGGGGTGGTAGSCASPEIHSVSGAWGHQQEVTIAGCGFGSKDPAEPLVWDPCDHADPLSSRYDEALPDSSAHPSANMAYRAPGFRGIDPPHGRDTTFIAGAHHPDCGCAECDPAVHTTSSCNWGYDYRRGSNVGLTKAGWGGSTVFFASYYYRVDPAFPPSYDYMGGGNLKELCVNGDTTMYSGEHRYWDFCNSQVPSLTFPDDVKMKCFKECDGYSSACCHDVSFPNPMHGWQKWQWEFTPEYGRFAADDYVADGCEGHNVPSPQSGSIGGFKRFPNHSPTDAYRYFADVYLDNTFSRVILTDQGDYESSTIFEPQIPTAWTGNTITVTVNLGRLPDSSAAYLFVFDAANQRVAEGYPVTLGP